MKEVFSISGVLIFIVWLYIAKLHIFNGSFKRRIYYGIGLSLYFTLILVFHSKSSVHMNKILLLSLILSSLICYGEIKWFKKKLKDNIIYYSPFSMRKKILIGIFAGLILQVFLMKIPKKLILNNSWILVAISFSLFISQVSFLFYILNLEKKVGKPLLEQLSKETD